MSDHQETLDQTVKRIEASFAKIKTYGDKVDQFRSSAGKLLCRTKSPASKRRGRRRGELVEVVRRALQESHAA